MENVEEDACIKQSVNNEFNFQILQENYISFNKLTQSYECQLCNCFVVGINKAYEHVSDLAHSKLFEEERSKSKNSSNWPHLNYIILLSNGMAKSKCANFYVCYVCNYEFIEKNFEDIILHINQEDLHDCQNKKLLRNEKLLTSSKLEKLEKSAKYLVENTVSYYSQKFYCNFCERTLQNFNEVVQHIKGKLHQRYYEIKDKNILLSEIKKSAVQLQDLSVSENRIGKFYEHKHEKKYQQILVNNLIHNDDNEFVSCDTTLNKVENGISYKILFQNCLVNYCNYLKCYLCQFSLPAHNTKKVLDHIYNNTHHKKKFVLNWDVDSKEELKITFLSDDKYEKFVENGIVLVKNNYYCDSCHVRLHINDLQSHLPGRNHQLMLKKQKYDLSKSCDANSKLMSIKKPAYISPNNSNAIKDNSQIVQAKNMCRTNNLPEKLTKSVKEKKKINNEKLLNCEDQRKKKPIDEKFPYNQELLNFSKKYISMCLELCSENIYSIDPEKIHYLLLGSSMIFNLKKDYICILCNFIFPGKLQFLIEHLQHVVHLNNLYYVEESSKESKESPDKFNDLDIINSCMVDESDECVQCLACEVSVNNSDNDIKLHINSDNHASKIISWKKTIDSRNETLLMIVQNSWYYVDKFFCKICNMTFNREINFAQHLEDLSHIRIEKSKKSQNGINFCYACLSCWYGTSDYCFHYKDEVHNYFMTKNNFIFSPMKETVKKLVMFANKNIENFVRDSNKTMLQKDKEKKLLKAIEDAAKPKYPHCKAYIFGSRNSFLSFCSSDVDVFLDCENNYKNIGSKEKSQKYIRTIKSQFFIKNEKDWKNITILLQPRVPLIKTEHWTGLKCDISFISGLAVEKTNLIRNYVIAYQPCREMILFLKKWFDTCDLYGTKAVNAYGISWCVIFFLQIKGIFPSVNQLIKLKNISNIVDGWECGFLETIPVAPSNYSSRDLLAEFFSYYANFDYCNDILCPLLGKVIKKSTFIDPKQFPEEMAVYKNRLETEEIEYFRFDSPMCIQDPVDLSQNITKAVKKKHMRYLKNFFKESNQILKTSGK